MGFKLQYFCAAALFLCLMKAGKVRAQCTRPSFESKNVVPSGSQSLTQSFPDGSTLTFECLTGYKPVNSRASKSVTCEKTRWTDLQLECTRKSCGSPPNFDNGYYEKEGILFGDKITAVCDKGYILAGQMKDRWCRSDGWDGREPVCEAVKCEAPPPIENGQLKDEPFSSYKYSEAVSYECNPGFSLIGTSTLSCSEDGTFKPDPPKCLGKSCGSPPDFANGHYETYKITAVCNKGYILAGQEKDRWCRSDGWDGRDPVCEPVKCEAPPLIENGRLEDEPFPSYSYLQTVSYRCNPGFSPFGATTLTCSEDGTFKPDPPKCWAI